MEPRNAYADASYAAAYAKLEFPGTYYLAYRDLPGIIARHVAGRDALDFGCGAGRSTRFLRRCGLRAVGVDISEAMIREARTMDPEGEYRLIEDGDFGQLPEAPFDLVLCAFTFDNIATMTRKVDLFRKLGGLLARGGRIVNLVSSPDIYTNEWASFSTRDFPENARARSGDIVRIITTAVADGRPVEDVMWPDDAYLEVFRRAGLVQVSAYRPLGKESEPQGWVSETRIAPWVIYVLGAAT